MVLNKECSKNDKGEPITERLYFVQIVSHRHCVKPQQI